MGKGRDIREGGKRAFCPANDFFFRPAGRIWGNGIRLAHLPRRSGRVSKVSPPALLPPSADLPDFQFCYGSARALSLAFRVASTSSSSNEFGRHSLCSHGNDDTGRIFIHSFTTHRYVRVFIFRCVPAPAIDGIRSAQRGENRSVLLNLWIRAIFKLNGKKWLNFPMESRNQSVQGREKRLRSSHAGSRFYGQ